MRKLSLFFLGVFLTLVSTAQKSKIDEGWQHFYNNSSSKALVVFKEATRDASTAEEAYLGLCFVYNEEGYQDYALENFQNFYKISANPYPYMDVLWNTSAIANGSGIKDKKRLKFLKSLLKDPKLPGDLKARLHSSLGDHFEAQGEFKDAKEEFDQIGSITKWMCVGSFENISASGFDKGYEPITNPQVSAQFKNKLGANVNWFTLFDARLDRWVDLEYYFYAGNSIIYSQNFVNSPVEQEVQLRFGVSGSIKVWLNDQLILSESEERNNGFDSYWVETTLKKGYNRVLIQIGESEADNSNFMMRITDANGENIQGLTFEDRSNKEYDKSTVSFKPINPSYFEFFEKKVEQDPSFVNLVLLAKAYSDRDMRYQARKVLNRAQEMAPKSSYVVLKLINVYQSEGNRTAIAKAIEWLKENDKDNIVSLDMLYDEAVENKNYAKADSLLKRIEAVVGSNAEMVYEKKMDLYGAQEKNEELIGVIETAYSRYPDNYLFVFYKSLVEKSKNNNAGAIKVLKKYAKKYYNISILKQIAQIHFSSGSVYEGLDVYKQLVSDNPIGVGLLYELADIYVIMQNYNEAINLLNTTVRIAPTISKYWELRGKCYAEKKDYISAKTNYKRALELNPTNFDARTKSRELEGLEADVFKNFPEIDVYKAFNEGGSATDYPDDNSAILVNSVQRMVYGDGVSEEKHTLVVKVFNKAGIDRWKEYRVPYYSTQEVTIEKVEVLKANGTKLEAERNGANIVFTNLEAGDGIHITYKVENYQTGKLAPHFTDKHYFDLFYPVKYSSYSLLIDSTVKFQYKFSNKGFQPVKNYVKPLADTIVKSKELFVHENAEPTKTVIDGYTMYQWERRDIPAIKSESYMTDLVDYGEVLFISSFPDWKFISNWYSDLAKTKAKSDFEVKETAQELFKGKENLSKLEKAKLIHEYIVKNIRYSSVSFRQSGLIPQKASKVINTRVGDCKDVSTLFVALCREVGIDSVRLVLINTRDNGQKDLLLPSIDFNHCIGNVTIDGKEYFVELTSEKNGFTSHPTILKNSYALKVYDELEGTSQEPSYLAPATAMPDNIIRVTDAQFSGKEMTINTKTTKYGDWASDVRHQYADIPETERRKKLLQNLTGDNSSIKLNTFKFNNLDAISDSIVYDYNYTIGNTVTQITGLNIFNLPWSTKFTSISFLSNEERKYPVKVWGYLQYNVSEEIITLTLPEGKKLAELPQNVHLKCNAADYTVTYKAIGNKIEAKRTVRILADIVPVAEYNDFKKFFEKVVEEDTRQLAFK
ncbi:MAG: tetratricopeptide repeat protein [Bacteroidota bacterium]